MKILILTVALLPAFAFASGTEGHGADAIVCRNADNKIVKREMDSIHFPTILDFHEGYRIGKTVDLGPLENSVRAKFNKIVDRLRVFSPTFAQGLQDDAKNILLAIEQHTLGKVEILHGVQFTNEKMKDLDDDQSVSYPEGCNKEQFVIRSNGNIPDQPDYMIKRDILEASDNDIVAGMVFHEVVFKYSVNFEKIVESPGSRYFVRNFAAPQADSYTFADYAMILTKAKFSKVNVELGHGVVELGIDKLGKVIKLAATTLKKRDDGLWIGDLVSTLHLSDGYEEAGGKLVFDQNKTPNEELTRLANPRRIGFDLVGSSSSVTATLSIGGQTCSTLKERLYHGYTMFDCWVYLPRGVYDYEITFDVVHRTYVTRWTIDERKPGVSSETRDWFWSDKTDKRPSEDSTGYVLRLAEEQAIDFKPKGSKHYPNNKATGRVRVE